MQKRLRDAGLYIATGRLTSPMQGDQSWLAHATLFSGPWLPSQRHYELLLAQCYPTLTNGWNALDDGEIFAHWEDSGVTPKEPW